MTKQKEIREVIKRDFGCPYIKDGKLATQNCDTHIDCDDCVADWLLRFLDSKGVVIKVERELPKNFLKMHRDIKELVNEVIDKTQYYMLRAGYVAVEPLIKEAENVET